MNEVIPFILHSLPEVLAVYVFGTTGSAFERAESDVDLAILSDKKLATVERFGLQEKIAQLLRRDVDLIDLYQASTVLRFQIVSTGQLIFCADKYTCQLFEMVVYSSYIRLNEERREILNDIKKRGRIFHE